MKVVCVDIETTGLDPATSDVLEVGLVAYEYNSKRPFVASGHNTLRIVLVQEELKGNIFALNMNKHIIEEILDAKKKLDESESGVILKAGSYEEKTVAYVGANDYYNIEILLQDFLNNNECFVQAEKDYKPRINLAGKNLAMFDMKFLERILPFQVELLEPARRRIYDIGNMFLRPDDEHLPDLKTCLERVGIFKDVAHDSVEDAVDVIQCLDYWLKAQNPEFVQQFETAGSGI